MAYNYEIDKVRRIVITSAWDVVTGAQVLEHRDRLTADPDFNPDLFQLVDFSRVTKFEMDAETVAELSVGDLFSSKSRRAFVAPTPLGHGMARMFISFRALLGAAEQMEVFDSRLEALEWLFISAQAKPSDP
jgi:hypothetical protein